MENRFLNVFIMLVFGVLFFLSSYIKGSSKIVSESLPGQYWVQQVNDPAKLSYRFISESDVEMFGGGKLIGVASYVVEKNKIKIKHSCGTTILTLRNNRLFESVNGWPINFALEP